MKLTGPISRLDRFESVLRKDMRKGLLELGSEKLAITQQRVPVEEGDLKATGRVSARAGEKQVTLRIIYGDNGKVNYAAWVHEKLEAKHPRGGQAKYVESVILETRWPHELAAKIDLRRAAATA